MCNMASYKVNMNVHAANLEEVSIKEKSRISEFGKKIKIMYPTQGGRFFQNKSRQGRLRLKVVKLIP